MKKKNPAITAVLNFFLPGLGFTYLGSPFFIVTGIAFFVLLVVAVAIGGETQTKAAEVAHRSLGRLRISLMRLNRRPQ